MHFNLGKWVVKFRHAIFIIAVILLIPSAMGMVATRVNYDMLTYLPDSIDTVKGQETLMDEFGVGAFTLITVEDMKTNEAAAYAKSISEIDHVKNVLNLQNLVNPNIPIQLYPELIAKTFANPDASLMVVFYDTSTSAEETIQAVDQVRALSDKAYVNGMTALVLDLKHIVEHEEFAYVAVAVILSLIAMMILVDSYIAPLLFLASIGCAVLYNLGSNIVFGEISFITKAIAAVLQLGVTMDYSIFLWHRYSEELDANPDADHKEIMAQSINETLVSVTGSSITTVAGFLALCAMSYTMGKDLGIVMAKGVVFGVICSVTVLPVMILRCTKLLQKTRHKVPIPDLSRVSHKLTSKYVVYILIFVLLLVPAVMGYHKMNANISYDFTKLAGSADNLDEEYRQFITAQKKVIDNFDIANSYIIIADADMKPKDGRAMCEEIEKLDGIGGVIGVDALLGDAIPREALPDSIKSQLIGEEHQMILINTAYLISTDECNEQIDKVNEIVKRYDPTATVIGEGPATKDLINITAKDFLVVNIISIALVFLIILFVLKSATLPVILVAAIEFAIYANLGICGFTGDELPFIVPVCISTIQLGSTVDYAILFSTRYKGERMSGLSRRDAIDVAATNCIPSVVVSAIGFFTATFGVAVYSNIGIVETFCQLMARGAIISMLTVIFLLPSLLMAFDKIICKTTIGMKNVYNGKEDSKTPLTA